MGGGLSGGLGEKGGWGVKNFFPHPNELLIWAYPENLVEIEWLVEAVETFPGTGTGTARDTSDYIDNLSLGFGFGDGFGLDLSKTI